MCPATPSMEGSRVGSRLQEEDRGESGLGTWPLRTDVWLVAHLARALGPHHLEQDSEGPGAPLELLPTWPGSLHSVSPTPTSQRASMLSHSSRPPGSRFPDPSNCKGGLS